jgi:hypothetical protein
MKTPVLNGIYEDENGFYFRITDIDDTGGVVKLALDSNLIGKFYYGKFRSEYELITNDKKVNEILAEYEKRKGWIIYRDSCGSFDDVPSRVLFLLERAFLAGEKYGKEIISKFS